MHRFLVVFTVCLACMVVLTGCNTGQPAANPNAPPISVGPPDPQKTPDPQDPQDPRDPQAPSDPSIGSQWAPDPATVKHQEETDLLGELPPGFPEEIPMPPDAFIRYAGRMEGNDGSVELTVVYEAGGMVIDAFYMYRDYFRLGGWEQIDYDADGDDPRPYTVGETISAEAGNVKIVVAMHREGGGNHDTVGVTVRYEQGNVYLSDSYEDAWHFRNEHMWEPTAVSVSFDQTRWRNQKIYDLEHLPPGWPREFHVPAQGLHIYKTHQTATEPSSRVQVTGNDDGSKRLMFTYTLTGRAFMPYQVHKGNLEDAGFTLIHDTGEERSRAADAGVDEPLMLIGTRDGEALQVIIWQQEFMVATELIYDENFDQSFYDEAMLGN